jgi:hypothetical protein
MSLEQSHVVDAIGTARSDDSIVLNIIDSWNWENEGLHLAALQRKLNAYFEFVESKQILESCPEAKGRRLCISIISRFPTPEAGLNLLAAAAILAAELDIEIKHQVDSRSN